MKDRLTWSPRLLVTTFLVTIATFSAPSFAQTPVFPVPPEETLEMPNGDVVEIYKATVSHVSGNRVTVRFPEGTRHTYEVPSDYRFNIGGRQVRARDLNRGDELSAYVTKHPTAGHELHYVQEEPSGGYTVVETVQPEAMADPAPATLPSTASPLPLVGLFGILGLGLGALGFGVRSRLRS